MLLNDEEIVVEEKREAEFFLGTVITWSNVEPNIGVQIQLDGQDSPTTKRFKMMQMCRPLKLGSRVVVMKQSGTYIVLGEVSNPIGYYHPSDLSSNASLTDVINRCNLILAILRHAGIIWNP